MNRKERKLLVDIARGTSLGGCGCGLWFRGLSHKLLRTILLWREGLQDRNGGIIYPISDQTSKWSSLIEIVSDMLARTC